MEMPRDRQQLSKNMSEQIGKSFFKGGGMGGVDFTFHKSTHVDNVLPRKMPCSEKLLNYTGFTM